MDGSPPTVRVSGRNTPLDYVFLTRPVLMPPVWTIALLGSAQSWDPGRPLSEWTFLVVQLWCLFGAVYVLNQIADIESDRINRKLFFLPEGIISQRAARVFTITLNVIAVLLGALFGVEYLGLTIVIIMLGFVYSLGHRPWKNKPVLGFLANVIAHGLIVFAMGAAFAGAYNPHIWIHATAYACAVGAVYLATTVADVPGDRASGKRTIAVAIGGRLAMLTASLCVATAMVLAVATQDLVLAGASILSLPVFAWAAGTGAPERAPTAAKAGVATLTLGAAIYFPVYLILLAIGFFATRAFFHWRFKMTYPTFG